MADSSKTEQATPKRRDKAREQGQIARSRELPGVFALAAAAGILALMAPSAITHWSILFRDSLYVASSGDIDSNGPLIFWSAVEVLRWIAPILLGALVVSVGAGLAQGGVNIAPGALALKFERFNPSTKVGQIFSAIGLSNLLKSLLPFAVILWLCIGSIQNHWQTIIHASSLGLRTFASFTGSVIFELAWKAGLVLLTWSAVDYVLTLRKLDSDMKMSKQEVRQESKEIDGNPVIKQRIRQLQRNMRKRQSLKAAATATVIITNPTHYAIALRYEVDMVAPVVVAKGRDLLAERIKALAKECGIMLIENRALAQALYKSVEVGDSIPARLYQAVAEILVIVFRAQAEVRKSDSARAAKNASGQPINEGANS